MTSNAYTVMNIERTLYSGKRSKVCARSKIKKKHQTCAQQNNHSKLFNFTKT